MSTTQQEPPGLAAREVSARAVGVRNEMSGAPAWAEEADVNAGARKPSRLWLWFVAAFVLQLCTWTAWFLIASQNRVEEVPLASAPAR